MNELVKIVDDVNVSRSWWPVIQWRWKRGKVAIFMLDVDSVGRTANQLVKGVFKARAASEHHGLELQRKTLG